MRRVLVLAVVPAVLAACGSGASSSSHVTLSPVASVKQSAKKTAQATSEHMTLTASAAVSGQKVVMTGSGRFDNTKKQGDLTMHANVGGLDLPIEAVEDGTTIYLKSAIFQAMLPAGKSWLAVDLQKAGKKAGIDFGQLLAQDPAQQLAQLQAAGDVTDVGSETIDGAPVEHYRARLDLSKLPQGSQIQKLVNPKYQPEDIYVGKDDGYIHRLHVAYTAQGQAVALLMNFSDFGQVVTVSIPPASETVEATNQALKGLGG
jgi:hypothetical protein